MSEDMVEQRARELFEADFPTAKPSGYGWDCGLVHQQQDEYRARARAALKPSPSTPEQI